jgi:bacterioferritin (cytochrome b1)
MRYFPIEMIQNGNKFLERNLFLGGTPYLKRAESILMKKATNGYITDENRKIILVLSDGAVIFKKEDT